MKLKHRQRVIEHQESTFDCIEIIWPILNCGFRCSHVLLDKMFSIFFNKSNINLQQNPYHP